MAKSAEELQKEREDLIRTLVGTLQRRGYEDIRVSRLEEYAGRRPVIIYWEDSDEGFMPDVMARREGRDYLFQVETAETVSGELAARQAEMFAAYARHYRRMYGLAVPQEALDKARHLLLRVPVDEQYVRMIGI